MQLEIDSPAAAPAEPNPSAPTEHVRFNFVVNVLDGTFFGLGLGLASFVTIIPLFVAQLTTSTVLIGMIGALHNIGWQLPQLLTAQAVARLRRYKPMVLKMTFHERWPFFGMAVLALLQPIIGTTPTLIATFIMVTWQAFGGGFTATAWQSMMAKLMPVDLRGSFYGVQSAMANLLASGGAVVAGAILTGFDSPVDFALCFFLAGIAMTISGAFLATTREHESPPHAEPPPRGSKAFVTMLAFILRSDGNFRWFILARSLIQYAALGLAFYTIYATREFEMDAATAGVMTGLLLIGQTVASAVFGRVGDRYGHKLVFVIGTLILMLSALLAWQAPALSWFYLVFALGGAGNGALWAPTAAIGADFGTLTERPYYIGLLNTLVAPVSIFSPIIGGWLADEFSFGVMFASTVAGGALALLILLGPFYDPRISRRARQLTADSAV